MIISLIHIALIKILCTNIFESSVTYIHVLSYTCTYYTYTNIISTSLHSFQEKCFNGRLHFMQKLQNYHFNRILELMLILVINGLTYQGRDIHSIVCQVWSESKIHV